jgi:malate permease and related proteins
MLLNILGVIAPVLLCALIGFAWVKRGFAFDTLFVTRLVTVVGAPCLVFATFMEIEVDLAAFTTMVAASLISILVFAFFGWAALKALGLSQRAFLPTQMFPNVGNMGLPLSLLAFGEEGLALALTYFMISTMACFTVGMAISSGTLSWRALMENPVFHSVWITLALLFSNTSPPAWMINTTKLLAGLTIPLMLIALGVSLAQFQIRSLGRSVTLSAMRLTMGFLTALGIASALNLEGAARGTLILQCSMPVAVFTYLFAQRYDREPAEVAGTVVISTLMSFLSLPVLLWFILNL